MFIYFLIFIVIISTPVYATNYENYNPGKTILKLIFYIIIVLIVLIIAIYGTKFIAKKSKRFINSRFIQIIDSLNLGVNFKIIIVEISDVIYILAITTNNIVVIDKIPKEEFNRNANFEEHLIKYKNDYLKDYDYFSNIQNNIKKIFVKPTKDIDKEDEYNEKND